MKQGESAFVCASETKAYQFWGIPVSVCCVIVCPMWLPAKLKGLEGFDENTQRS